METQPYHWHEISQSTDDTALDTSKAYAIFGDCVATDLLETSNDPSDLEHGGWWAVAQTFEGKFQAFRFATVRQLVDLSIPEASISFADPWQSSMSKDQYVSGVNAIRADIARGWVYQVNLCRVLTRTLHQPIDPAGLWQALNRGNPAPHGGALFIPATPSEAAVRISSFSPELFLRREEQSLLSSPIKGTATSDTELLEKDTAENIMIVDLIRNDFSHIAQAGTVRVTELLRVEPHPGLVHLVSDVVCQVRPNTSWIEILEAMTPPGSVSGAPKSSALEVIQRIETVDRGIYCGAFGWIDTTQNTAQLAVGIRTFWQTVVESDTADTSSVLHFGTGAGITWGSDPIQEWRETELKSAKLFALLEELAGSRP